MPWTMEQILSSRWPVDTSITDCCNVSSEECKSGVALGSDIEIPANIILQPSCGIVQTILENIAWGVEFCRNKLTIRKKTFILFDTELKFSILYDRFTVKMDMEV